MQDPMMGAMFAQLDGVAPVAPIPAAPRQIGGELAYLTDAMNLARNNPGYQVRDTGDGGYVVLRGGPAVSGLALKRRLARERTKLRAERGLFPVEDLRGGYPGGTVIPG